MTEQQTNGATSIIRRSSVARFFYSQCWLEIVVIICSFHCHTKAQQLWSSAPQPRTTGSLRAGIAQSLNQRDGSSNPLLDGVCSIPSLNPCTKDAICIPSVPIIGEATCRCSEGFTGDGLKHGRGCTNVDECRSNLHDCDLKTMDCVDLQGTYECKCKQGYDRSPSGKVCLDIDECHDPSLNACDSLTMTCRNLEGSYRCDCKGNQIMDENTKICRDLDECNDMDGAMNPCEQICKNRNPGVECACEKGYKLRSDGTSCEDVDECQDSNRHVCDSTGLISKCVNTVGGYYCNCSINLGYRNGDDLLSCRNFNECEEYPYICGGAGSCCKDLSPPQRFACTVPPDGQLDTLTSGFSDTIGAVGRMGGGVSSAFSETMSAVPSIFGLAENGKHANSSMVRNLQDENNIWNVDSGGSSLHSRDAVTNTWEISRAEPERASEKADSPAKVIIAGNMTLQELHNEMKQQLNLSNPALRSLQFLPTIRSSGPLQNSMRDRSGAMQSLTSGLSNLRITRSNTCPAGFSLGADLQRSRTRRATMRAVQSALTSNMKGEDGEERLVTPKEVTDGMVKNTALISSELQKWITELVSIPEELINAAGPLSSPLDSASTASRQTISAGGGPIGALTSNSGLLGAVDTSTLASLLIGGGIGKLLECTPAEDPFCDRTGKSRDIAYNGT
ncbi:calcium binding egf domain-containing protein [Cardiosporidium cionae]|uniref:Calcium binding egf domain-containing protein n=1 Tax=Cardiosporidium cionae TaxID=476202 RepID=A0ABQ7J4G3_9APIC|nr:calcium binding egf domain-containing protein [Cardiosporidium cionae]|eukprot:KAF8818008.1 calcium binding egf domain-containing protein [Cardiosporidium cionae]